MNRIKRSAAGIVATVLAVFICISAMPSAVYALPECHYAHCTFTGEDCYAPGSIEASYVDYLQGRWKCDTRLAKKGQLCGKWSNSVLSAVAAKTQTLNYKGLRFNEKNFLSVCQGCKVGTKLVLGQATYENGTLSHAIVLLKVTSSEVWWADCNWNHDNVIHDRHGSVTDFINFYHYKSSKYSYLHFVKKVVSYRTFSKPETVSTDAVSNGTARIAWTKTAVAGEYEIYRSDSKKGSFSLIGSTSACSYTDRSAAMGKTYFYKVKAIKSDGTSVTGKAVSARTRLDRPHASIVFEDGNKKGRLVWNDIEGADSYVIYRKYGNGKWKKMKTVTGTSYTDSKLVLNKKSKSYWYKVYAVKSGSSGAKSLASPWVTPTRYAWVP